MKFKIVCVGKIKEKYFIDAINEYTKRISRFSKTEITEVPESYFAGIPSKKDIEAIINAEGESLLDKCEGFVFALDICGVQLDSVQLAEKVSQLKQTYSTYTFIIGGSHGLSDAVKARADFLLSFGKITLPHQLCRVVLCEQLYRICSLQNNLSYHK